MRRLIPVGIRQLLINISSILIVFIVCKNTHSYSGVFFAVLFSITNIDLLIQYNFSRKTIFKYNVIIWFLTSLLFIIFFLMFYEIWHYELFFFMDYFDPDILDWFVFWLLSLIYLQCISIVTFLAQKNQKKHHMIRSFPMFFVIMSVTFLQFIFVSDFYNGYKFIIACILLIIVLLGNAVYKMLLTQVDIPNSVMYWFYHKK